MKRKYKFDARFLDDMMRVSWDTAATYAAKGCILIATRYSGESGARRLREQGYAPEMIEMMKGAGVRCFKHRAGMPVLGIIGKMMNTRFNGGVLPLLDSWIRKVDPDPRPGGQVLLELHLARRPRPVTSLVERDAELRRRSVRHALLQAEYQLGQEFRREQDAGSALEARIDRARGPHRRDHAGIQSHRYRADYWIPVRPQTDSALFLGACKLILDENLQDIDYIKQFTDLPLLVRTDTLQYLDPRDVIADFKFPDFSKSYSGRIQSLKAGPRPNGWVA